MTELAIAIDDIAGARGTAFEASLETGTFVDREHAISEEVGEGGQTEMALTADDDTPALEPLTGEAESRSEDRAAEETE